MALGDQRWWWLVGTDERVGGEEVRWGGREKGGEGFSVKLQCFSLNVFCLTSQGCLLTSYLARLTSIPGFYFAVSRFHHDFNALKSSIMELVSRARAGTVSVADHPCPRSAVVCLCVCLVFIVPFDAQPL